MSLGWSLAPLSLHNLRSRLLAVVIANLVIMFRGTVACLIVLEPQLTLHSLVVEVLFHQVINNVVILRVINNLVIHRTPLRVVVSLVIHRNPLRVVISLVIMFRAAVLCLIVLVTLHSLVVMFLGAVPCLIGVVLVTLHGLVVHRNHLLAVHNLCNLRNLIGVLLLRCMFCRLDLCGLSHRKRLLRLS